NIQTEFSKASVHPVANTTGVHDPTEDSINPTRHVECADCHNPHATKVQAATAPAASGALTGVKGVNASGAVVNPLANEYELCFRCHADSTARGTARVTRQVVQTNTRLEFQPSNLSYHPIEAVGKNSSVPSLISPWTASSRMFCTDCHNNNQGPGAGGTGPKGPHGSAYVPLLERRLDLVDNQTESATIYALCYKCHSRTSILGNASFKEHSKHVTGERAACTTCHDSHGVTSATHLINFNKTYVTPSSSGRLEFIDNGVNRGTCYLTCHGENHNPLSY
ncbi:MAG TPA: cytochrome C, partial [Candidatus Paceibacterota bacterium]|nr:cytochrome C [Candidatus Paceibacterota bacterium]